MPIEFETKDQRWGTIAKRVCGVFLNENRTCCGIYITSTDKEEARMNTITCPRCLENISKEYVKPDRKNNK